MKENNTDIKRQLNLEGRCPPDITLLNVLFVAFFHLRILTAERRGLFTGLPPLKRGPIMHSFKVILFRSYFLSHSLSGFPLSTLSVLLVTYCGVQLVKERERQQALLDDPERLKPAEGGKQKAE